MISEKQEIEVAWQYQGFDHVPRAENPRASDRPKFSRALKMRAGEIAEVFIATSGVLAVLVIVLGMTMMVRGIRSLRRL